MSAASLSASTSYREWMCSQVQTRLASEDVASPLDVMEVCDVQ
jgi:hypothetical protein